MTPAEKFLNEIAAELETAYNIREQVFFSLRYAKNRSVVVKSTEIAKDEMPKYLGSADYATSIGTTAQNVRLAIVNKYEEEMTADGVDVNILRNGQVGQGGTWRTAYHWLWQHKYPRWLEANRQWIEANSWDILREKATSPAKWIQFLTNEEATELGVFSVFRGKNLILPPRPAGLQTITPIIPAKQSLWMVIDLKFDKSPVLLLNRSQNGECLLCPSSAYAPNAIMEKPPILLPQKDSWADQDEEKTNFKFDQLGKEEFLAIVLQPPLNLPWLTPREDEALIEWNGERILDVFKQLEQSGEWQVFYQSFEVVESETKADNVDNG